MSEAKVELGLMLFFDPILSGNYGTACSACHLPEAGWAVQEPISFGYVGSVHWRNSQTIVNSAYYSKLFWAGSSRSLESQARSAARGAVGGNGEDDMMEARLAFVPEYRRRFREVFGDDWPNIRNAYRAIAAAVRGPDKGQSRCLVNRRSFLLTGGIATTVVMVGVPGLPEAQTPAVIATYPRKLIARLSELVTDEPVDFTYPDEGYYAESILVKLGRRAGGGIGPDEDVVAFNYTCTHQGGPLQGTYKARDKALGPCPLHLTTFDLTRHGIFISGQAYQSLPQVLLELDGDEIHAVGMFGLIYGRYDNLQG